MDEKRIAPRLEEIPAEQMPEVLRLASELYAQDRAAIETAEQRRELLKAAAEAGLPPEYLERAATRLQAKRAVRDDHCGRRRPRRLMLLALAAALLFTIRAVERVSRPPALAPPVPAATALSAAAILGPCFPVDLRSATTNRFSDSMLGTGGNNLLSLVDVPAGVGSSGSYVRTLGGVRFRLDGVVLVGPGETSSGEGARVPVRPEVDGIPIHRKAQRLHFLQSTHWQAGEGEVIGVYVVHYVDGAQAHIPIRYGQDVVDWWTVDNGSSEAAQNHIAWVGNNDAAGSTPIRLFTKSWENPRPKVAIESLDMVTGSQAGGRSAPAPFLVGLTVEGLASSRPPHGDLPPSDAEPPVVSPS
jgi:hypothetical protein